MLKIVYSNSMLAEKLGMDIESAEKWIVNLMRTARLDAKIDSEHGYVVMMGAIQPPNPWVIKLFIL